MKILHTSDWHIGRTLYGQKRYEEFEAFLSWLADTLRQQDITALLVAGDIFDTSTPSNRAQQLYYQFLYCIASSSCRHVIVIAGNHDSPSFLDAPKALLRALDVHVIGAVSDNLEDEVIVLKNPKGNPELIVCAVPYLRDRAIRTLEAGESIDDKERKIVKGIRTHYEDVCELAEQKRHALGIDIPIVAMGHLFTAGGETVDGDGVRELYVGSLAHVTAGIFPTCVDYLALGHLHVPQKVNGSEIMRYSGSPIPMGFGEAKQQKSVCIIEFTGRAASVSLMKVPIFQKLERIRGNWATISAQLSALAAEQSHAFLEIIYDGNDLLGELHDCLELLVAGTHMQILRIKNNRMVEGVLNRIHADETLDDLTINEVFERYLFAHDVPDEQRDALRFTYQETIAMLNDEGVNM